MLKRREVGLTLRRHPEDRSLHRHVGIVVVDVVWEGAG